MRIARFSSDGGEPRFGVVGEAEGEEVVAVLVGDPLYAGVELTGERMPLADVRLLAPVIPRSKVVGIGRNYAAHAAELGNEVPDEPLIFLKPNTSVIGPGDPIVLPRATVRPAVRGRARGRDRPDLQGRRGRAGARGDLRLHRRQRRHRARPAEAGRQWARAKGFDTFCPLGPWIETDLDVSDLRSPRRWAATSRQDGRTSLMIFDVPTLVSYVSSVMTLLPGDVILTGTPAGVGPMVAGDQVSVTVEGIGTLTNPVVARD